MFANLKQETTDEEWQVQGRGIGHVGGARPCHQHWLEGRYTQKSHEDSVCLLISGCKSVPLFQTFIACSGSGGR